MLASASRPDLCSCRSASPSRLTTGPAAWIATAGQGGDTGSASFEQAAADSNRLLTRRPRLGSQSWPSESELELLELREGWCTGQLEVRREVTVGPSWAGRHSQRRLHPARFVPS
jgi:hypothetical protein